MTGGERGRKRWGGRERGIRIRTIHSFRPLPLMKGCRWMTYHLTVNTMIISMSKKTNKLTTMRGEGEKEREGARQSAWREGVTERGRD